jgi:hypothetical protein
MQRPEDLGEPLQAAVKRRSADFGARRGVGRSKRERGYDQQAPQHG